MRTISTSPRSSSSRDVLPPGTWAIGLPGGAEVRAGGRAAGDFANPAAPGCARARRSLADVPWTWLRQVHGARALVVARPGDGRGEEADAAVTSCAGAGLAVLTADCAPLCFSSPEGVVGVAHAGWRGLMGGVVEAAVTAMRQLGAERVFAALGPCIFPHAYRFSAVDIQGVVDRFGPRARSTDAEGYPALDLPAAVGVALERAGAGLAADAQTCTHCSGAHWSWRARGDTSRQATVVWRRVPGGGPS